MPTVYRVYVEGAIGAGKSKFIEHLSGNWPGAIVARVENVDEWKTTPLVDTRGKPTGGTFNLLMQSYDVPAFRPIGQIGFLASGYRRERKAIAVAKRMADEEQRDVLLVLERSVRAGPVFVRANSDDYSAEELAMYWQYYEIIRDVLEGIPGAPIVGTVYLKTSVAVCFSRMIARDRTEEIGSVTVEYATKVADEMNEEFVKGYQFDVTEANDCPSEFYREALDWISSSIASLASRSAASLPGSPECPLT